MPTARSERTNAGRRAEPDMTTLKDRYRQVQDRIAAAAKRVGRSPESIVLVAVTKYATIDQVRELIELGHTDFGENQVQNLIQRAAQIDEFLQRHKQLGAKVGQAGARAGGMPRQVRWHMIGHLQRNKVRKVLPLVRLIHSVDSLRLAEEIQQAATRVEEPVEVLVQINAFGESSKFGIAPAAAKHLIDQIDTMLALRVRGLMVMAPIAEEPESLRSIFERTHELFHDIRRSGAAGERFDILSMGMSNDFDVAIEAGANMVRVGSAIFGNDRPPEAEPEEEPEEPEEDD
jgi:pyridoxal phosphate enzyme (YggS family)